ncbi:MAG: HNH endonuclease, partial [Proteobacteria bacterium]
MQSSEQLFIQKLSDAELLFDTREAIKAEREATSVVVKYFREISARELYLEHACSSLFQFATEKLGYCAASAQARINAMELVVALPEVERQIESGELSLTAAAKVQSFFRAEKRAKKSYSDKQKLDVVSLCLSKSTREVERELAARNPSVTRIESVKPVGRDSFELRVTISEQLEANIRKLKGLLAHSQPGMTTEDLLITLVELGLEKLDPARKAERAHARRKKTKAKFERQDVSADKATAKHKTLNDHSDSAVSFRAHETPDNKRCCADQSDSELRADEMPSANRYIPAHARHAAWRANACKGCEYETYEGATCGSQHALQIDHVIGVARGGSHDPQNLRILCA